MNDRNRGPRIAMANRVLALALVMAMLFVSLPLRASATDGPPPDPVVVYTFEGLREAIRNASDNPNDVTNIVFPFGGELTPDAPIVISGKRINITANHPVTIYPPTGGAGRHFIITDSVVTLTGFMLTGQALVSFSSPRETGGILQTGGSLTLSNTTISGCAADNGGGVLVNGGGTLIVENSTITNNTANKGGGVYIHVTGHADMNGGAILNNTASAFGGGVYTEQYDAIKISDVTFVGNTANAPVYMNLERSGIKGYYDTYIVPSRTSDTFDHLINNYDVYLPVAVISYDANGASGTPPTADTAVKGAEIPAPGQGTLTRTGMRFLGWSNAATAGTVLYKEGDLIPTDADLALFALWEDIPYTLHYDIGNGIDGPADETLTFGNRPLSTVVPTHEDVDDTAVVFVGWMLDAPDDIFSKDSPEAPTTVTTVDIVDDDVTVYAAWSYDVNGNGTPDVIENTYRLTYDVNGGNADGPDALESLLAGTHPLSSTGPTHAGVGNRAVVFRGWTAEPYGTIYAKDDTTLQTIDTATIVDADVTVYAAWGYAERIDQTETPIIDPVTEGDDAVTGTGIPGAEVEVTFPDVDEPVAVEVGEDGTWVVPMPDGYTPTAGDEITAVQTEGDKDTSEPATTIVKEADSENPEDEQKSETPTIAPVFENDGAIGGGGVPGASVTVTFEGDKPVTVPVKPDGTWTAKVPDGVVLKAGDRIPATQTEPGKLISDEATVGVTRGENPDGPREADQTETPIIDPVTEGDDAVTGTGVPGAEVEVTFPGVDEPVFAEVDEDGEWTVPMPDGYTPTAGDEITAVQTEPGKDTSEPATTIVKEADSENPEDEQKSETPTIAPVFENDGAVGGGGIPGASVTVTFEGDKPVTVPVKPDGTWTAKVPDGVVLKAGDKIPATQTEPGKLISDEATVGVTRGENPDGPREPDRTDAPTIDPVTVGDNKVTGTGVPGAEVEVTFPGVDEPVIVKVNEDGKWSTPLPDGYTPATDDEITAVQTEPGKDTSEPVKATVKKPAAPGGNNNNNNNNNNNGGGNVKVDDDRTPLGPGEGVLPYGKRIPYIFGYTDGSVRLDTHITRAEVAAIFFRLLEDENKDEPVAVQFTDMTGDEWYAQSVAYLSSIGILTGYPDGSFGGGRNIARAEFATIVARFEALAQTDVNPFNDLADDYWAVNYILSATAKGWVEGYVDGSFRPNANLLRSETIKIINIMLDRVTTLEDWEGVDCLFNDIRTDHWAYAHMMESSVKDDVLAAAE